MGTSVSGITPRLWATYAELRRTKANLDAVQGKIQAQTAGNPDLIPNADDLLKRLHELKSAFPEKPLDVSVAVIGTFKGGKSTLINALLGAELLPAAVMPVTAAITHIRHRSEGFRVRIEYLSSDAANFRESAETLVRLLADAPSPDAAVSLLRDPLSPDRKEVELQLGLLEAVQGYQVLDDERLSQIWEHVKARRALPDIRHKSKLGTTEEFSAADIASMERQLRPYVAFSEIDGAFDAARTALQLMVSRVWIEGPFNVLASEGHDSGSLTIVDTPGLSDPRPAVKAIVYKYLEEADCVCLNLANKGNFSEEDVLVVRQLLASSLHRKLIVAIGAKDAMHLDDKGLGEHVRRQRDILRATLVNANLGTKDSIDKFVASTPILPVSALASLARNRKARGEAVLDTQSNLAVKYPTPEADGTAAVYAAIRDTLDSASRLTTVVNHARQAANNAIVQTKSRIEEGIKNRDLSAADLEKRAAALTGAVGRVIVQIDESLIAAKERGDASWAQNRKALTSTFDMQVLTVAASQHAAVRAFTAAALKGDWRHWRRLDAVRKRGNFTPGERDDDLRRELAHSVIGAFVARLREVVNGVVQECAKVAVDGQALADAAVSGLASELDNLDGINLTDVKDGIRAAVDAELAAAVADYQADVQRAASTYFEVDVQKQSMQQASDLVTSWIGRVKEDRGAGLQGRMHEALKEVLFEFVDGLPTHARSMFGSGLDQMLDVAQRGATGVQDRVANSASRFLRARLHDQRKAAQRAKAERAESLAAEKDLLQSLLADVPALPDQAG